MELDWENSRYPIGASIGTAMNRDMADEKSWLEAVDEVCYIAKRDGRGLLRIAALVQSDELHTKTRIRNSLGVFADLKRSWCKARAPAYKRFG